ncbi:MAG: DUF4153 domain-containing protein [Candidatus Zixiibacteriota bacterium]
MKLPSIEQIWADYNRTYRRFPLTQISAIIITIVGVILVERENHSETSILYNILLPTILALPLLTSLKLAAEREDSNTSRIWLLQIIGVALLVVYAFTIPADLPHAPTFYIFRFFAFAIGCCLLFSFLPFLNKGQSNGFWQFNRVIVFRSILAGAFAVVLFAGLGLALAALENLFGMNIPSKRYFELWIMIMGLFVVPFILSGIPENLKELEEVTDYPRSLKVFGQYVLPPLVLVYSVILYAYIAKIIITWNWPQGWVGRLILGFSATGILALFVLDPIREKMENFWIKRASRWYYMILFPLIFVLFLALWRRISEYGLTEDRYMGLAIGVWLAIIAGYFLLSRSRSIKMIPVSLCVLTFLISVGPWGMFSVSEQSQIHRLKEMLIADSILVNGMVQKAPSPVSDDHEIQISSILYYMHEVHGFSKIEPWFAETLRLDSASAGSWFKDASYVAGLMGVEFNLYKIEGLDKYFSVAIDPRSTISVSGYEYMAQAKYGRIAAANIDTIKQPTITEVRADEDSVVLRFVRDSVFVDSAVISIRPLIDRIALAYDHADDMQISGDTAILEYETADFKAKVVMLRAHFERQDSNIVANSYEALVLYSRKGVD